MREIVNVIDANDFVPSEVDLFQMLRATRRQFVNYAPDSGAVNAMIVTLDPALEGYHAGLPLRVVVAVTNTGPTTINVNGLGTRAVRRGDNTELQAGDIRAGMIANIVDTGTVFQLQNPLLGTASTTNVLNVKIPYAVDTGTVNTIVAPFSPVITSVTEGDFVAIRNKLVNTGAMTVQVNALAPIALKRNDGLDLKANDLYALEQILIENHSSYWQVMRMVASQDPAAPSLRGMIADGAGFAAQGFGPGVAGGTPIAYNHLIRNSMQVSSWDGFNLTVGTGEDGVWAVYAAMHTQVAGVASNFSQVGIFVDGVQQAATAHGDMSAGTAMSIGITAHVPVAVGQKIQARFYHQAPGTTIYSAPDNATRLSAYLIPGRGHDDRQHFNDKRRRFIKALLI
jgi:hypothetical protein